MKYCANCGNMMEDDMLFCQKCGTKFKEMVSDKSIIVGEKLEKLKKYNLILEARTLSWKYLCEDEERTSKMFLKQSQLCEEVRALVEDILTTVSDEDRDLVEREVYTYVLQAGYQMCKEGEKLFADYSGLKEYFEDGTRLVIAKDLDADTFLDHISDKDYIYESTAGLQGLFSSRIKEVLDEEVIYNNMEYRSLTKQLAQAFNDMWDKSVKRKTDFFFVPNTSYIDKYWNIYVILLKGLHMSDIDVLDEKGWDRALEAGEKHHNGWQYRRDFIKRRDEPREAKRREEQEIADKKYWESHQDEYKQLEINKEKIKGIFTIIDRLDEEIRLLRREKGPLDEKKYNVETQTSHIDFSYAP